MINKKVRYQIAEAINTLECCYIILDGTDPILEAEKYNRWIKNKLEAINTLKELKVYFNENAQIDN